MQSNSKNRVIDETRVVTYMCEMLEDKWVVNGESIKFSAEGELLDGQHRLMACIEAKVPFTSVVVRGVASTAFTTIDVGKTRTNADIFHIAGFADQNNVAAIASISHSYENGYVTLKNIGAKRALPKQQLLSWAEERRDRLIECNRFASSMNPKFMSRSMLGALRYLFGKRSHAAAEAFLTSLCTGEGLLRVNPAYVLRERLIANASNRDKMPRAVMMAYCIIAWNKFRADEEIKALKLSETFPKIR